MQLGLVTQSKIGYNSSQINTSFWFTNKNNFQPSLIHPKLPHFSHSNYPINCSIFSLLYSGLQTASLFSLLFFESRVPLGGFHRFFFKDFCHLVLHVFKYFLGLSDITLVLEMQLVVQCNNTSEENHRLNSEGERNAKCAYKNRCYNKIFVYFINKLF